MPILSFSTHRAVTSWLLWLLVLVSLLLARGPVLQPDAMSGGMPADIWQSPYDPVPWLGRALRLRWSAVWWKTRAWINAWERWLVLAFVFGVVIVWLK